ncbi:histidine kinase [Kibdelosporangium philippinense]|uniref:histidine kinase n=1 Tax=Kibdelosporangium philippinense TaxID=211113 RepID=A0ABS8Z7D2_9PSEU|nr:histidine kinase [Kibdelosporangium philippinense]MCE7002968.1 histidine kinase [Kibdelosporangium philippinense]
MDLCGRHITLITILVGVCSVATGYGEYASGSLVALDIAIGIIACALVPLLFRWPVATALVLAVLAAISPTATPPSTIGTLQVSSRQPFPAALGVAVFGIAAHAVRFAWHPLPGLSFAWWMVLVVITHLGLLGWGALAQARRQVIASLRERAERAEAEQGRRILEARAAERTRIAREMHDVLAHRLSLLATYAGALEYRPDLAPEKLSQAAGVIRSGVHQALDELRDVITVLRDKSSPENTDRPVPVLDDLPTLVEESRAVGTPVDVNGDVTEVPGATSRTAYRVLQEALTNARKHAPGQPVKIDINGNPGRNLIIEVTNPLCHADTPTFPGTGTGLIGLTERVRLAGGKLDHEVTAREFRLHALLPWPT